MLFPENIEQKLGFDTVRAKLIEFCQSSMGKELVQGMRFNTRFETIDLWLNQTNEFSNIIKSGAAFPTGNYPDLQYLIDKVAPEGAYFLEEDLVVLRDAVQLGIYTLQFFENNALNYPTLSKKVLEKSLDKQILKIVAVVIDPNGRIRANASKDLEKILQNIATCEKDIKRTINHIFKNAASQGYTGDNQLTVRDGRMVVPLLAEHKRKIKGYMLDESATGQLVFIEPVEVYELNNQLRDYEFEKRKEIIKILTNTTDELRPFFHEIAGAGKLFGMLDFIRAKARFSVDCNAVVPQLVNKPILKIINARHPILEQTLKNQGKKISPLSVTLQEEGRRIMVVSGPNAGGKSVTLKTVGLLQIMLQCGLPVPVLPNSEMGIFKGVFADIGDNQSIESDLSTYSAHLFNMSKFVTICSSHSLVLIDELGAGTDPKFGGPIAEAVLDALNNQKVKGVVTTHYSNLKIFAQNTEGLYNAAMLFDITSLQPLYELEVNKPGSSYAMEIAQKSGLSKKVIQYALDNIGSEQQSFESLLIELEKQKKQTFDLQNILAQKERKLNQLINESAGQKQDTDQRRVKILDNARAEAKRIVEDTKILAMQTIKDIKQDNKKSYKQVAKDLDAQTTGLDWLAKSIAKEKQPKENKEAPLQVGEWVQVQDTATIAEIVSMQGDSAILAMGDVRLKISLNKLERADKQASEKAKKGNVGKKIMQEQVNFYPQIDLRGKRGDSAMKELESYIDRAVMLGFPVIKVLHGKGDGILRKLTREYLKKYEQVKTMEDEAEELGGAGVTVVHLGR